MEVLAHEGKEGYCMSITDCSGDVFLITPQELSKRDFDIQFYHQSDDEALSADDFEIQEDDKVE